MIERVIDWSIRHRWLTLAGGVALALAGLAAAARTPVDAIPDLSENQVIVFTDWMGHGPREIEDQITYPVTIHLRGLPGVRVIRSSSDFHFSMISVIFEDSADFDSARRKVAERLGEMGASLPAGVAPRLAPDSLATGQIFWYTIEGRDHDLGALRALQDWTIKSQLASVPGVAEVASVGGFSLEYQVELDPRALAAQGLAPGDIVRAIGAANQTVGGHVIEKSSAEYVVSGRGWLGAAERADATPRAADVVRDLERVVVPLPDGSTVPLEELAKITLAGGHRRGVLEKDGAEVVGGVVLMRHGENALATTRRLKAKIAELSPGLPPGVRIVSAYDRVPLIEGAIGAVTATLAEAMLTATILVLLVLLHFRAAFVIAITLPLAAFSSFLAMALLRWLGWADIQTNIMSLAGVAISIGVLVDSSIVMAENVMCQLKNEFGERPVRGDTRRATLTACRSVGRPIFFSVLIMLISFLPVFALGGSEGKMFRPLAFTKSFALASVACLAITLVPALCTIFIRGRLRSERESWLTRALIDAYRPTLSYFLNHPAPLAWLIGATFVVGLAPVGYRPIFLVSLGIAALALALLAHAAWSRALGMISLLALACFVDDRLSPLPRRSMVPLREGMVMDMPISAPTMSITQAGDDLKARDMILCRFPEVAMVIGKAGRAETSSDPAPLDMIETMVEFRPREHWPSRGLQPSDAQSQSREVWRAMVEAGMLEDSDDAAVAESLLATATSEATSKFDAQIREYAYQRNQEFRRGLGRLLVRTVVADALGELRNARLLEREVEPPVASRFGDEIAAKRALNLVDTVALEEVEAIARALVERLVSEKYLGDRGDSLEFRPSWLDRARGVARWFAGREAPNLSEKLRDSALAESRRLWTDHVRRVNDELPERAAAVYTRLIIDELLSNGRIADSELATWWRGWRAERERLASTGHVAGVHHGGHSRSLPVLDPFPPLDAIRDRLSERFARGLLLWPRRYDDLASFGGELDRALQMPGWTNVWTMPIQNRVDMLNTGINTEVGARVMGRDRDDVIRASERIAEVVKNVPGAADVVADPIRGKGYLDIRVDRERALLRGVSVADVNETIETALGGKLATTTVEGRERRPVRVRYPRDWREDEASARELLVRATPAPGETSKTPRYVPLGDVADARIVEGPVTIKSENGWLRNYVRMNVRGRDATRFVDEARRVVAERVALPEGVHVEWTGQFEHEAASTRLLSILFPIAVALILAILYFTYRDLVDALLVVPTIPGAIAGGVFFQWLLGHPFSVTVWVGYIACFGMATSTGIIMLVYLREAVANAGGLENLSLEGLRAAVMEGAVHRLRPKLLTEGTTIIGLAPMLWAQGPGGEIFQAMAAPVLGGILVADEVIDLLLPIMFYWSRRWRWERIHRGTTTIEFARRFGRWLVGMTDRGSIAENPESRVESKGFAVSAAVEASELRNS